MLYFEYGEKELNYLKKKDKRLAAVIQKAGVIQRELYPDIFVSLVNSIAGQQISRHAKASVWRRFTELLGGVVTPQAIDAVTEEQLRSCGLSGRKAVYIKRLAQKVLNGEIDFGAFAAMADEEVIAELVKLDGIGKWTAEMQLIFSLGRANILSGGDVAIQNGLKLLYGHKKNNACAGGKIPQALQPVRIGCQLLFVGAGQRRCGLRTAAQKIRPSGLSSGKMQK